MANMVKRYITMFIGLFVMTFAIRLTVETGLGTTPLSTLPNVASFLWTDISFGVITFFWNLVLIAAQIVVLRKRYNPIQLLQIPLTLIFSAMLDFHGIFVSRLPLEALPAKLIAVVVGCVILAFSISVTVKSDVIMNSGEAVVKAFSDVTGIQFGYIKVALDVLYVAVGAILSFALFGKLCGIGVGTLTLALLTGFIVKLFDKAVCPLLDIFYK